MIQNVLLTTLTSLRNKDEINCWENQPFTTVWPENVALKPKDITRTIKKKKPKRVRTAFSTEQLRALEKVFSRHKYVDSEKRAVLAKSLNIEDKCIKIWFQNRRMKEKKESSESSCDSSSESVGNEMPSGPSSPLLQVHLDQRSNDLNQFSPYNNAEQNTYQLPTYYNTNHSPSNYGNIGAPNFASYFYHDSNIYPTQYYPFEVNYSYGEANGFSQYATEINNCWSNHYPYYSGI